MLALLLALLIWPFSGHHNNSRNQSRDWYARHLQHIKQQHVAHRKHKQTWLTDNR